MANATRVSSTIAEYFSKMKALADDMASAGKKLEDDEIISYILAGLDEPFNPIMSGVSLRVEPISIGELYAQLVTLE